MAVSNSRWYGDQHTSTRASVRKLWYAIARTREARGDIEGAKQARFTARNIPTIKYMRKHGAL